ncbi:PAS domain S-box-containing protein [Pseudoduganella flava]|uniref:histidine kinase n=1 Tax=Pseudoduganella flava TaxID=871742 RepID=A0A562PG59_9BURK|nr:HAMP domain-containing sensor histidine kinase [Pseudoduganella flava]QGZ40262.1 PAS domain S-box protein [Pseudoduganella flava]TWI43445.1 PAS domain S-box-containing protein [Pseudoduganella flava]
MEAADFRLLLEHSGDVHWMADATGRLLYVSPAAARRLGCTEQEALARAQALAAPLLADLPARLERFRQGDDSRRTARREAELDAIPVEIESTLVERGGALHLVGVVRDISARREFELQQKKFASMLSHEFRTPLSTIDGAIQRLEMTAHDADEATRKRYRKIQTSVDRLLAMLDEYLSPDRLAAIGRQRSEDGIAPLQMLEAAATQARARRPQVTVRDAGLPAWLRADPHGMRMCIDLLLDNAIKYSPADSPVELLGGKAAEGGVEFAVVDHGPAIPEAELGHVFDKGFRGSAAVGIPGSGLGLYMTKAVVDVHGGTVTVENLPESGKKFRIWLPRGV